MLFALLRERTADLHQQIEARVPILRPGFDVREYRTLLERFYGFYQPVESRLSQLRASGLDVFDDSRRKTPWLQADLHFFGYSDKRLQQIPLCSALPELTSVSAGIGCLYVLEGATLGGRILSRHLASQLDIHPGAGGSFFAAYGDGVGARWMEFRQTVEAMKGIEPEVAVSGARDAFSCFDAWLAGL